MNRLSRFLLCVVLALFLAPGGAQGQFGSPPRRTGAVPAAVDDIVRQIEMGHSARAQEMAEKLLAEDGGTYASFYVLGRVYHECAGDMARGRWFLMRARQMLEERFGERPKDVSVDMLHEKLLQRLARVCQDMDQYEEALEVLRDHDRLYPHKLLSHYGWVLMKMGRFDEAREACRRSLRDPMGDRIEALNALAAIDYLDDRYEAAYDEARKLLPMLRSAILLGNAGEIATSLLRFADAERYLLEASRGFETLGKSRAWERLALLYAAEGRLPEAISAIRNMHKWYARTEPADAQQVWAEYQMVSAVVMMTAGSDEKAVSVMARILARPDRRGGFSGHQHQFEIALLAQYHEALRARHERLQEARSWITWRETPALVLDLLRLERELWWTRSRAASVAVAHDRLAWSLRPYATDSLVMEWLRPGLNDILGYGVVAAEVQRLFDRPLPGHVERERPYQLALLGEGRLRRGDWRGAVASLEESLGSLPTAEEALKARVRAGIGLALERGGDGRGALVRFTEVMERQPQVLRYLGVALPAVIESDQGAAATAAASMLARSPRFRRASAGFTVRLAESGDQLTGTFMAPDGSVLATCSVPRTSDATATAREFAREFHQKAFSPRLDLSQGDVNSLDGSNETGNTIRDQSRDLSY